MQRKRPPVNFLLARRPGQNGQESRPRNPALGTRSDSNPTEFGESTRARGSRAKMARNPALGIPPPKLVRIRIRLSLGGLHVPEGVVCVNALVLGVRLTTLTPRIG